MSNLWKWERGRQQSGYDKLLLATGKFPIRFDCYLIRYKQGSYIDPHRDPVTDLRHFRLNIIVKHAKEGGEFITEKSIYETSRIKLFRPDVSLHSVQQVRQGTRYVLSIGWAIK